jgi:protein tyrosine/serine phosphatase
MAGGDRADWWTCKAIIAGAVAVAALVVAAGAHHVLLGGNFCSVIPGDLYRCAQPSAAELERLVRCHGIRVVVNLRGDNGDAPWYVREKEAAARLGVRLVDVPIWAKHAPLREHLALLVDTLSAAEGPVLVHCNHGGDRAGLASALGLLVRSGKGLDAARGQLALHHGHNVFGMARCLGHVLDQYEAWLQQWGAEHSPARLRRWAREAYQRELCR